MKRGSTYPITVTLEGVDLTGADWIILSVKPAHGAAFEFSREQMSVTADEAGTVIAFQLSQEQSLALRGGGAEIDCNWSMDGQRAGSNPTSFVVGKTLLERAVYVNG